MTLSVKSSPARFLLLFVLVVGACYLLVWPVGEYAVEDDWAYVKSLSYLHDDGAFVILDWNPMTLVGHLLWGGLFTKLLGFSFTVTKLSTVALLVLEGVSIAAILRRLEVPDRTILLAVLTVLFSPIHFFQSFLYATDVPTLAWGTAAVWMYSKGLMDSSSRRYLWLVVGSMGGSMAFACRQPGILVVAAFAGYVVFCSRLGGKRRLASLVAGTGLPAIVVAAFAWWYFEVHGPTTAFHDARSQIRAFWAVSAFPRLVEGLFHLLVYSAFFVLPLLVALPQQRPLGRTWRRVAVVAVCGASVGAFVWQTRLGNLFPYLRNKISHFGMLSPNEFILGDLPVLWTDDVGWPLTILLLLAALALVVRLGNVRSGPETASHATVMGLLIFTAALQAVYLLATLGIAFDRHLILVLPTVVLLIVGSLGPRARLRSPLWVVVATPLALYGIASTHDVHAISRAAHRAGARLVESGVDPGLVDGGYAFTGWHMYERSLSERSEQLPVLARAHDAWWVRSLCPRVATRYVVSLTKELTPQAWADELRPRQRPALLRPSLRGYEVVASEGYRSYWALGRRELYLLSESRRPIR